MRNVADLENTEVVYISDFVLRGQTEVQGLTA